MQTLLEQFLAKTRKTRGCWWWLGHLNGEYKRARFTVNHRPLYAAHVAYELFKGPRNGLWVLHTCDNPQCVNPKHLYLGTHQDNMDDKIRRGRTCRGESRPLAKLTEKKVQEIRRQYRRGNGICLAKQYKISRALVSLIVNRKIWTHI